MTSRARVLVGLVVLACATVSCVDQPRDDQITGLMTAIYEAAGADEEHYAIGGYRRETFDAEYEGIDDDDRWVAIRGSFLAGGIYAQDQVYEGAREYLLGEGFELAEFRTRRSGGRALVADAEELQVQMDVSADGGTSLDVYAGPLAARRGAFSDREIYEPVPPS